VDPETDRVVAEMPIVALEPEGGAYRVAVGEGAVWAQSVRGSPFKVDPATNEVVAEVDLGDYSSDLAVYGGSMGATAQVSVGTRLFRVDPRTAQVVTSEHGPDPPEVGYGEHGRKSLEALPDPVLFGRGGARTLTEVGEEATRTNGFELDAAKAEAVRGTLIPWFEENGRDLPWRRTRDPWRVLVSEVMLQQIQVTRAVPFYESFVALFPTPRALSEAPLSEAIRAWGDLGRYRRVVSLHRTARLIVEEHGGEVPSDPEALLKLPGVGPYTAGAVACFAFERDAHFLDTNIRRVLHRLFLGAEVPEPKAKESQLLGLAEAMVPRGRAWGWGQSVMELGALRCKARKPLCAACPVGELCAARPTIAEALAGRPRAAGAAQGRGGPNRHHRGRVLAVLREAPPKGVALGELGRALREGFGEADLPWLRGVVESLVKDGLARVSPEEAWSADPPRATVRVSLP